MSADDRPNEKNLAEAKELAAQIVHMLKLMGNRTGPVLEALGDNLVARLMLLEIAKRNPEESACLPPAPVGDEKGHAEKVAGLLREIVEKFKLFRNTAR